jgi:hypothetical protein
MHKNEATSGLIRYLALLAATQDVSVSLPGDPAPNTDITPSDQVSGDMENMMVEMRKIARQILEMGKDRRC